MSDATDTSKVKFKITDQMIIDTYKAREIVMQYELTSLRTDAELVKLRAFEEGREVFRSQVERMQAVVDKAREYCKHNSDLVGTDGLSDAILEYDSRDQ